MNRIIVGNSYMAVDRIEQMVAALEIANRRAAGASNNEDLGQWLDTANEYVAVLAAMKVSELVQLHRALQDKICVAMTTRKALRERTGSKSL